MLFKRDLYVRDKNESHRAATPLELFYDLIFVVAIAKLGLNFHHAEHIEERFGLLAIIVLGESILSAVNGIVKLVEHYSFDLLLLCIGCIITIFSAWWIYFSIKLEDRLHSKNIAFLWGYGHYLVYASIAAIGAMVSVNIDIIGDHALINIETGNLAFAISVATFLISLWITKGSLAGCSGLKAYALLLVSPIVIVLGFFPHSVFSIGILMSIFVMSKFFTKEENIHCV